MSGLEPDIFWAVIVVAFRLAPMVTEVEVKLENKLDCMLVTIFGTVEGSLFQFLMALLHNS